MTDQDILDISGLIYHRWTQAFQAMKRAKDDKNDGSPDWELFHADMVERTIADEKYWKSLSDRYIAENKPTLNKIYGL